MEIPLTRPSDTLSPSGGEGRGEGARWSMNSLLSFFRTRWDPEPRSWVRRRDSVLDCGSPLPLLRFQTESKSARGLAQSKTWRPFGRFMGKSGNPETHARFPSWEGPAVGAARCPARRLAILFSCLCLLSSVCAESNKLNLFIWSEYLDPQIVKQFEKQSGCTVTIDVYEDAESMLAKIQGGGVSLYDVVVPPDHLVPAMVKLKLLAPLRHENIPNLKNLDDQFANPPYDRGNHYTVAYQWGTVGVYLRKTNNKPVAPTWGILFDPKQQSGSFVLIDSVRDLVGAALKYKGYSLNSTDPAQLKEARDLILDAKKRCVGFEGSVGAKNKVLAKTARAAIVYSGEAARGIADDAETLYFIPKEGSQIWLDNLAVLAKAPHRDLAERFINFLLDAKVGAQLSNFTQFATPNKAARPFLKPEALKNPAIYPPPEVMARLEFLEDLGANTRLYDEVWTQIKAK